jgi:hypothetical protein
MMKRVASGSGELGSRTVQKAFVAVPSRKEESGGSGVRGWVIVVCSVSVRGVREHRGLDEAYDSRESSES